MLPPLMFSEDEIEAMVLGSRWVAKRADPRLALAAGNALAKIAAVLPQDLREDLDSSTLLVGTSSAETPGVDLAVIRAAIRAERKLSFAYTDAVGAGSHRTVWPFALGFFEKVRVLVAWCETRQDFRHFRTERIADLVMSETRYPRRRQALLKDWKIAEGISHPTLLP